MTTIVSAAFGSEFSDRLHSFIKQIQKDNARSARRDIAHDERFSAIEADTGFLAMLVVALMKLLADKGIVKDGELFDRLLLADRMDGVEDGTLDVKRLRAAIGLQRGQSARALAAKPKAAAGKDGANAAAKGAKPAPRAKAAPVAKAGARPTASAKGGKKGK